MRTLLVFVAFVTALIGLSPVTAAAQVGVPPGSARVEYADHGDVNCDGVLTVEDVEALAAHLRGEVRISTGADTCPTVYDSLKSGVDPHIWAAAADANDDGVVNNWDLIGTQQCVAGQIGSACNNSLTWGSPGWMRYTYRNVQAVYTVDVVGETTLKVRPLEPFINLPAASGDWYQKRINVYPRIAQFGNTSADWERVMHHEVAHVVEGDLANRHYSQHQSALMAVWGAQSGAVSWNDQNVSHWNRPAEIFAECWAYTAIGGEASPRPYECPDLIFYMADFARGQIVAGDINCDGTLDIIDALVIAAYVAGNVTDTGSCNGVGSINASLGDTNFDGEVTVADAMFASRCDAGLNAPACP